MTLPARVEVRTVGPEAAAQVRAVVLPAFHGRPPLDPPAAALDETEEMLAALLAHHGGLIASFEGEDVGALVLDPVGSTMYLRRFGVDPGHQGHGVARALIDAAVEAAKGYEDLTVVAREELPNTIQFWERQGFREILRKTPNVELRRPLRTFLFDVPDAEAMRELGDGLAGQLAAGDLIVLSGELGAGKTTFTQGLGKGLGVRGDVTSPTFVIARVHPSLVDGPDLVHADAYRLGGIHELDDLDLDTSLDDAVTVVEWGEGVAEGLAESRLEVRIIRALAHVDEHDELDPRRVLMTPIGPRWHDLQLPSSQRPPLAEKVDETLLLDFRACAEDELDGLDAAIPSAAVADDRPARRPGARGAQRALRRVGAAGGPDRGRRDTPADRRATAGRGDRASHPDPWRSWGSRPCSSATRGTSSSSPSSAAASTTPPSATPAQPAAR